MAAAPREIDRKRWRRAVVDQLDDYPRQLEALRYSAGTFGEDFDLAEFAGAFSSDLPERYTRVQAIERAFGQLQNAMAALADNGTKLAELPRSAPRDRQPRAQPAFETLRDTGAITKDLCARLVALQKLRNRFEHDYVKVDAQDVHEAVTELLVVAPEFLDRFARWIEPYLSSGSRPAP